MLSSTCSTSRTSSVTKHWVHLQERLISRQTRSTFPVSNSILCQAPSMLCLAPRNTRQISFEAFESFEKADPKAILRRHPLQMLEEGQVIKMQTTKGHDNLGIVKEVHREPHSYIIQSIAATSFLLANHHHHRKSLQALITNQLTQKCQTFPLQHRKHHHNLR